MKHEVLFVGHVQAILDQKKLTRLAGGVREGQNMAQNGPRLYTFLALEPFRDLSEVRFRGILARIWPVFCLIL